MRPVSQTPRPAASSLPHPTLPTPVDTLRDPAHLLQRSCLSSLHQVTALASFVAHGPVRAHQRGGGRAQKHLDDSNKEAQEDAEMDARAGAGALAHGLGPSRADQPEPQGTPCPPTGQERGGRRG